MPEGSLIAWIVIAGFYGSLVIACIVRGRTQRREVGASWPRLVGAALLLSLMPFAPLLVGWCFGIALDEASLGMERIVSEADVAELPGPLPPDAVFDGVERVWLLPADGQLQLLVPQFAGLPPTSGVVILLTSLIGCGLVGSLFLPIWRQLQERVDCRPIEDPDVVARMLDLADRVGAPRPRILACATDGTNALNAAAGGTLGPVVILSDDIVQRMESRETAALLAHELGHLKHRHVRRRILLGGGFLVLAPVLSVFLFPSVALVLSLVLLVGCGIVIGRREELACDRIAGDAVGFGPTSRTLHKLHGARIFDCGPALRRIVYAMQSHPAPEVRLRSLARAAPESQRADIRYDADEAAAQHAVDRWMLVAFVVITALGVSAGRLESIWWFGIGVMIPCLVAPALLPYAAYFTRLRYHWQLRAHRVPGRALARVLLVLGLLGAVIGGLGEPACWPTLLATPALAFLGWRTSKKRRVLLAIYRAVRDQDFARALQHGGRLPRGVRRGPVHRQYRAMLHAAMGDDDLARCELDELAADQPRFHGAQLLRATITSWFDAAAGLRIATTVADALPGNPFAMAHLAAHLARESPSERALSLARMAVRRLPAIGRFHGILACVLRRCGDLDGCARTLQDYEVRDPGAIDLQLRRAHLLIARGEIGAARETARVCRVAIERDRMCLLMHALDELEAAIANAGRTASTG